MSLHPVMDRILMRVPEHEGFWSTSREVEIGGVNKKLWSPEDDALLKELRVAGVSIGDIAKRLNRSYASVVQRCHKYKIEAGEVSKVKHWSPDDDALLRQLRAEGASIVEVCARLDRAHPAVVQRCRELGLPVRKQKRWGSFESEALRTLVEEGKTIQEIADELDRTYAQVALKMGRDGLGVRETQKRKRGPQIYTAEMREEFERRFDVRIRRIIKGMSHLAGKRIGATQEDIEDLEASAIAMAWKSFTSYQDRGLGCFNAWIVRVFRTAFTVYCGDFFRERKRFPRVEAFIDKETGKPEEVDTPAALPNNLLTMHLYKLAAQKPNVRAFVEHLSGARKLDEQCVLGAKEAMDGLSWVTAYCDDIQTLMDGLRDSMASKNLAPSVAPAVRIKSKKNYEAVPYDV
jgi:DNA-directed RNA polymerase specialized sigma24 family protein